MVFSVVIVSPKVGVNNLCVPKPLELRAEVKTVHCLYTRLNI